MYIIPDVLVDRAHQAPNADLPWPEPLCPRPRVPTTVCLVTTDEQCAQAAEQTPLWNVWVVPQVGLDQSWPQGLPSGATLLVATAGWGHLVVHHCGVSSVAPRAHNGALVLGEHSCRSGGLVPGPPGGTLRPHACPGRASADPGPPNVRWHSGALNGGWRSRTRYHWIPEASRRGAGRAGTPRSSPSQLTSLARGQWPSWAQCTTGRGWPPPSPCSTAPTDCLSRQWTPRSSSTSCGI